MSKKTAEKRKSEAKKKAAAKANEVVVVVDKKSQVGQTIPEGDAVTTDGTEETEETEGQANDATDSNDDVKEEEKAPAPAPKKKYIEQTVAECEAAAGHVDSVDKAVVGIVKEALHLYNKEQHSIQPLLAFAKQLLAHASTEELEQMFEEAGFSD